MLLKLPQLALTAAFGLALAFAFSCSDENKVPDDRIVKRKEKVSGVSQKGPFVNGAKVKIYELNRNMEKMGEPYQGTTDGNGNFAVEIDGVIVSPYISLEVDGSYVSEVSGEQTIAPITLNAVADVSKKRVVNINVFTHLEYDRVLKLARSGEMFEDAKKEAQKEVLKALGMDESVARNKNSEELSLFGDSKGDSLLLVASVLLQATPDVSNLLTAIGSEIKNNGVLSEVTRAEVKSGVEYVYANMDKVMGNILKLDSSARVPSRDEIKNIEKKIDSTATLPNLPSSSSNVPLSSSSGGQSNSGGGSSASGGDYCNDMNPETEFCFNQTVYNKCGGITYNPSTQYCKYGTTVMEYGFLTYQGKNYKTVEIGTQTWMAENLNYAAVGSKCGDDSGLKDSNTTTCNTYGRLYDWATAMGIDAKYNNQLWDGSDVKRQGICPSGWHIPSDDDWDTLMTTVGGPSTAGTKLKAASGWDNSSFGSGNGTDDYDFSALPGGGGNSYGNSGDVGRVGYWWSAPEYNASSAYHRIMSFSNAEVGSSNFVKSSLFSVRCVQD